MEEKYFPSSYTSSIYKVLQDIAKTELNYYINKVETIRSLLGITRLLWELEQFAHR